MASAKKVRLSITAAGFAAAVFIGGFGTAQAAADDIKGPSTGGAPAPEQPDDPIELSFLVPIGDVGLSPEYTLAAPKAHGPEANARHTTARTNRTTGKPSKPYAQPTWN
jgi:hypothetical protein